MNLYIHIVTCGRLELLRECCNSLARFLPSQARVKIIVNGNHPATVNWLKTFTHPSFSWQIIEKEPRAEARNRAFEEPNTDIIHFLDDDVVIPGPIFERVLTLFALDPDLGVLGGPNLTLPESEWNEHLFGAIMTSAFAAPMIRRRYGSYESDLFPATEHSLILCNLAVRTSSIPESLRFKGKLVSNEENLFLYECHQRKILARFSNAIGVYHRRRRTISSFAKQIFSYGFGRAQQTWAAPGSCHPAFFAPAVFCALLPLLMFQPSARYLFYFMAGLHLIGSSSGALQSKQIRKLGPLGIALAIPLTLLVHLAYGTGFWFGLFHMGNRVIARRSLPS